MIRSMFFFFAALLASVQAECPNACSSHGRCSSYDMCICYRNWMANDCSERVCQFGLAHVDSPKGDLDASGNSLTGPDVTVVTNSDLYPYGTQELFPLLQDSRGNDLTNTGHYYMECSNKGICDREKGVCECFPGYEGSACQRASCPSNDNGVCSGHGTCETISDLAANDHSNIYQLWDEESTMGCNCDPGYYGPDCSQRRCKYGADPLYADDSHATQRFSNFTFGFYTTSASSPTIEGNYSLIFYDVFGEDWETEFIPYASDCDFIIDRLVRLPNDVIHEGSVYCLEHQTPNDWDYPSVGPTFNVHKVFTLAFAGNVGILKQIEVNFNLDGPRPTLVSSLDPEELSSFVYADGFHGEFVDYVPDLCEDVEVTLTGTNNGNDWVLSGLTTAEIKLLKICLGDADNDASTNEFSDVENWDTGDITNPHLIKLVPKQRASPIQTRLCNATNTYSPYFDESGWCDDTLPGFYAPLYFDGTSFRLFGRVGNDFGTAQTQTFYVYTTTGYLKRRETDLVFKNSRYGNEISVISNVNTSLALDCESRVLNGNSDGDCLDKGDRVIFFNYGTPNANTFEHPNLYTVEKIFTRRREGTDREYDQETVVVLDYGTNFPGQTTGDFYEFFPPTNGGVSWANECSDRGVCQADTGLCQCFTGYTSDDCSVQNILAK